MAEHYVLVDCDRVQEYVFASPRLREICNASHLLDQIETDRLPSLAASLEGYVIRSGGGVVLVKFESHERAQQFKREAPNIYRKYGGSAVAVGHSCSAPVGNFYRDVLLPMQYDLRQRKDSPRGWGFHLSTLLAVPCESSGVDAAQRPVAVPGGQIRRMSPAAAAKRTYQGGIPVESQLSGRFHLHLPRDFGGVVGWTTREGLQEKDLPGTSEERVLGIVYADVNSLGRLLRSIAQAEAPYARFARDLREVVKATVQEALEQVLSAAVAQRRAATSKSQPSAIPARVLYVGGDDLAVAIQGRYAPALVEQLLSLFEQKSAALLKDLPQGLNLPPHLTMSAGLVLAPYNYPSQNFNRVGHELEARAKRFGRDTASSPPPPSLIDFSLIKNNAAGSLQQVRHGQRIPGHGGGEFLLYGGPYTLQTWRALQDAAATLKARQFPRNKMKQLRDILSHQKLTAEFLYAEWRQGLKDEHKKLFDEKVYTPFNLGSPPHLPRRDGGGYSVTPVIDLVELSDLLQASSTARRGHDDTNHRVPAPF